VVSNPKRGLKAAAAAMVPGQEPGAEAAGVPRPAAPAAMSLVPGAGACEAALCAAVQLELEANRRRRAGGGGESSGGGGSGGGDCDAEAMALEVVWAMARAVPAALARATASTTAESSSSSGGGGSGGGGAGGMMSTGAFSEFRGDVVETWRSHNDRRGGRGGRGGGRRGGASAASAAGSGRTPRAALALLALNSGVVDGRSDGGGNGGDAGSGEGVHQERTVRGGRDGGGGGGSSGGGGGGGNVDDGHPAPDPQRTLSTSAPSSRPLMGLVSPAFCTEAIHPGTAAAVLNRTPLTPAALEAAAGRRYPVFVRPLDPTPAAVLEPLASKYAAILVGLVQVEFSRPIARKATGFNP
jgi:hypothetical protein